MSVVRSYWTSNSDIVRFSIWAGHSENPFEVKIFDARTPVITPTTKAQVPNRNPVNILPVEYAESRIPLSAQQERTLSFYVCELRVPLQLAICSTNLFSLSTIGLAARISSAMPKAQTLIQLVTQLEFIVADRWNFILFANHPLARGWNVRPSA